MHVGVEGVFVFVAVVIAGCFCLLFWVALLLKHVVEPEANTNVVSDHKYTLR